MTIAERLGDRRATGRLCAEHAVGRRVHQAKPTEFAERLVDLGQKSAGRHRDHYLLRQPPTKLFGDLVAKRLRPFGVVGPQVDVDESPVGSDGLADQLPAQAVHVVVCAVDCNERSAVNGRGDYLARLEVVWDDDYRIQSGTRRGGCYRVSQVAGRCARQGRQPQLPRGVQSDGNYPILERVRRVPTVVLDPKSSDSQGGTQVVGADQPGPAGVESRVPFDIGRYREQWGVAPDGRRSTLDFFPRDGAVVIGDLEGPEAFVTGVGGTESVGGSAVATLQRISTAEGAEVDTFRKSSHGEFPYLIFPSAVAERRTWHLRRTLANVLTGCRGFTGPFPLPLWMSYSVVSGGPD